MSSSPPGPYHQDAYVTKTDDKLKHPPILPPHLLQVLLNKDTGISVSTSLRLEGILLDLNGTHNFTDLIAQHEIE